MRDAGQDGSMEDIMASIRRVIADDARPVGRPDGEARGWSDDDLPEIALEDDVLELDQPVPVEAASGPRVADAIVSENVVDASRSALSALAAFRPATAAGGEGPLEAVIRDMLRPMLKEWLDQRLPAIVEDIVAKEVARITGKG